MSRRGLVMAGMGMVAAGMPLGAAAQPTATVDGVDGANLLRVSESLTGVSPLPEAPLATLALYIAADDARLASFRDIAARMELGADDALDALDPSGRAIAEMILEFWYAGTLEGSPVLDREAMYFDLAAWKVLPYIATPTLCKSFGYWEMDVDDDWAGKAERHGA